MAEVFGRILGYMLFNTDKWWIAIIILIALAITYFIIKKATDHLSAENRAIRKINKKIATIQSQQRVMPSFTDTFKCHSCGATSKITVPGSRHVCQYCGAHLEEVDKRIKTILQEKNAIGDQQINELHQIKDDTINRYKLKIKEEEEKNIRRTNTIHALRIIKKIVLIIFLASVSIKILSLILEIIHIFR